MAYNPAYWGLLMRAISSFPVTKYENRLNGLNELLILKGVPNPSTDAFPLIYPHQSVLETTF